MEIQTVARKFKLNEFQTPNRSLDEKLNLRGRSKELFNWRRNLLNIFLCVCLTYIPVLPARTLHQYQLSVRSVRFSEKYQEFGCINIKRFCEINWQVFNCEENNCVERNVAFGVLLSVLKMSLKRIIEACYRFNFFGNNSLQCLNIFRFKGLPCLDYSIPEFLVLNVTSTVYLVIHISLI